MANRVGRPRSFNREHVTRLADKGLKLDAIIARLEIPPAVVKSRRAELKELVHAGNLRFQAALGERLHREGVLKGRSHALLALSREHLGFDRPKQDGTTEDRFRALIDGASTSLLKAIEKLLKNREAARADA